MLREAALSPSTYTDDATPLNAPRISTLHPSSTVLLERGATFQKRRAVLARIEVEAVRTRSSNASWGLVE